MADYAVVTEFVANASEALDSFRSMVSSLTEMRGAFAEVDAASAGFDERMAAIGESASAASREISTLAEKASSLDAAFAGADEGAAGASRALASVGESSTVSADEMAAASSRIIGEAAAMGAAVDRSALEMAAAYSTVAERTAALSEEMAAAEARAAEANTALGDSAVAMGGKAAAAGAGLESTRSTVLGLGAALGITDLATVHMAGTFESNMTRLQTEAGLSDQAIQQFGGSMQGVEDKVVAVGNATGYAGTEISNALYKPVSAGLDLGAALDTVKYAAEEARISGANLEDTTTALTAIMKDFGGSISSPEQGMATLNAIVGQGMMRFQDFNESIKSWAPTASTFGVSLDSAGAALAYMTDRGESAQSAGTKLAQVMAMMVGQTTQAGKLMMGLGLSTDEVATSNQAMAEAMSRAHITTSQLADDLRKPDGIEVALADLKKHLQDAGLSADAADSVLVRAFGGGRQFKGLAELISNLPQLQQKFDQIAHDENVAHFEEQWDRVSHTFQQHWADMIAAVKNFAIQIGTVMLPIFSTVADAFGKVFSLIGNNEGAVHALGIAFAAMSIAIPVIALGTFISKLSDTSLAMATTIGQVGLVAAGFDYGVTHIDSFSGVLATAVSGLAGFAVAGSLIKDLGLADWFATAGTAIGVFVIDVMGAESIMDGLKVIGSGLMDLLSGPWGIVLAVAAGAAALFATSNKDASQATDDLTNAIKQDSGALGDNTRAWAVSSMDKAGALQAARDLNIATGDVTNAVLNQGSTLDSLRLKLQDTINASKIYTQNEGDAAGEASNWTGKMTDQGVAAQKLLDSLNATAGSVSASKDAYQRQADAAANSATAQLAQAKAALTSSDANHDLIKSAGAVSGALNDANQAAKDLKDSLDVLSGGNIGAEKAAISYADSLGKLKKSLQDNGTSFDDSTAKGQANTKSLLDAAEAAAAHGQAVAKQTGNVDKGTEAFRNDISAMQDTLGQTDLNSKAVAALTKLYFGIPGDRNTVLTSDDKQALAAIGITQSAIDGLPSQKDIAVQVASDAAVAAASRVAGGLAALHDKLITVSVNTVWGAGVQVPGEGVLTRASGGLVEGFASGGLEGFDRGGFFSGAGTPSSDSNMIAVSDREYVVRASGVERAGTPVLDAINAGSLRQAYDLLGTMPGVASGTDGAALAMPRGGGPPGGMVVNVTVQGAMIHQDQVADVIRTQVLRYAGRNPSAGWAPSFT